MTLGEYIGNSICDFNEGDFSKFGSKLKSGALKALVVASIGGAVAGGGIKASNAINYNKGVDSAIPGYYHSVSRDGLNGIGTWERRLDRNTVEKKSTVSNMLSQLPTPKYESLLLKSGFLPKNDIAKNVTNAIYSKKSVPVETAKGSGTGAGIGLGLGAVAKAISDKKKKKEDKK